MTGRPVGTQTEGWVRRAEVGLCIVWRFTAVTVSLLSPPVKVGQMSPYLQVRLGSFPTFSRNLPDCVNHGIGHVKGDSGGFGSAIGGGLWCTFVEERLSLVSC